MAYDYKSDQITNADAVPAVANNPNTANRVSVEFFSYTIPAGNLAVGKTLELCRLRKGVRPLYGKFSCSALTTAGGTAGVKIGDGTTVDKYLAETSVDGASNIEFLGKQAEAAGVALTADTSIVATVATEAWAAAGTITGFVMFAGGH